MKLEPGSLKEARVNAGVEIHTSVLKKRLAYVSNFPGQDAVYSAKEAEALRYMAEASPDPSDYPFLSAEVGKTAATMADLATLWVSMGTAWRQAASVIESARMTAKADLAEAATVADVDAAMQAFRDTMEQM